MNSQTHSHINSQKRISDFELVTESKFFLVNISWGDSNKDFQKKCKYSLVSFIVRQNILV